MTRKRKEEGGGGGEVKRVHEKKISNTAFKEKILFAAGF